MEGDDGKDAAVPQTVKSGVERAGETPELVVDGDAQRLKHPPRGMPVPPRRRRDGRGNDVGTLQGGLDGGCLPRAADGTGDLTGEPFLAVGEKNIGKRPLVQCVHKVGGSLPALAHAHVERRVRVKRKTARAGVELMRGNADVEKDAVHGGNAEGGKHLVHFGEIRLHHRDGKTRQRRAGFLDGVGVAVERNKSAARKARGDGSAVPAAARRAVKIDAVRLDRQRIDGLVQEDGNMTLMI